MEGVDSAGGEEVAVEGGEVRRGEGRGGQGSGDGDVWLGVWGH